MVTARRPGPTFSCPPPPPHRKTLNTEHAWTTEHGPVPCVQMQVVQQLEIQVWPQAVGQGAKFLEGHLRFSRSVNTVGF